MRVLPDLNKIVEQCFNDGTLDDGDGFGQSVERIICKSGDKKYMIDCAGTENEIIEYQKNFWKNQIKQSTNSLRMVISSTNSNICNTKGIHSAKTFA